MKAQALAERAAMAPGYDPIIIEKRLLEALDIPGIAEVYPLVPQKDEQGNDTGAMTWKFPPQPDPELEIEKADMQRRTLEGKARAEKDYALAAADIALKEAQVLKTLAEAKAIGEEAEIKQIELVLEELQSQREAIMQLAEFEDNREERAARRLEQKSRNAASKKSG